MQTKTKTNLILKQKKSEKMLWEEPNSWPIRCHRTWPGELAVSCPSTILYVGGGRSSPRNFWRFWYDELWNNRVNIYDKLSLIAQDILAAPASQAYIYTLKGVFLCAACLLLVAETEWPSHCICELVWNWTKKYRRTQASLPLCELWSFNFKGNELQIS